MTEKLILISNGVIWTCYIFQSISDQEKWGHHRGSAQEASAIKRS